MFAESDIGEFFYILLLCQAKWLALAQTLFKKRKANIWTDTTRRLQLPFLKQNVASQ